MSNVTTTTTTGFAPQMQEYGLAQAQNVMNLQQQPYQPYSTNPNAFAAPMNSTQVAGTQNINNAAGMAQPYYANATSTLGNYLGAGTAALGQAYNTVSNAQNTGAAYNQAGMTGYQGAVQTGNAYNQAATAGYAGAPAAASGYNNMAGQGYVGAYNTAAPYTQTATAGYAAAPGTSAPYNAAAGQGYLGAAQAAAPLNQAATAGYANAPGASAPYNAAAGQGYVGASQAAAPLNQAAIQGYGAAPGASASQNAAAQAGYTGAASAANPYNQTASQGYAAAPGLSQAQNAAAQAAYANAPGSVSQYNQSALQGYGNSLTAAAPLNQAAIQGYTGATSAADPYNLAAAQGYASAPGVATPYNQMATSAINNAVGAGSGYSQNAMANYTGGLAASMPYTLGGAQAVNAAPIDAAAINQYLSPFLNDVYKTTLAGQNVQNAQQSSALQGTAAQANAFGGDRAGIAQANMAYQQNLANSQTNANLLNTGFANALAAAQTQQNVNLGAQQANRAAQASTGQNIYNQMSNTGQNIAGLGQQVYGQNLGASTALSGLGNQMFGQQTAAAQGVGNIGQQIYGQKIGAAQGMGNMGQQISNQNINAAQGIGNIGQQQFGQQIAGAAGQLAAGNQGYNQAMGAAAGQANVGNQVYNQNAQTATGQLAVGNQNYNQAMGAAQGLGNMAQQIYGQDASTAAGLLGVGNQGYNQAMGAAQGLGNMAQQTYGQGATTAAGLLGVGNQNYAQTMGAAQGIGAMGSQAFTQGNQTANSLAGLGNQTFNQQIASAQGLAGLGNQVYNQQSDAAKAALATGQNAFTQGATTAAQQAAIANSLNSMGLNAATTLGSLGGAAQTSALQGGQAQMTAGAVQQAIDQKAADAMLAQYNQSQAFPYTQTSWGTNNFATIAGGLTGQTTTQTAPGGFLNARGGAIKPHARASGGLIPDAASEGGTVSMGRAGQGFADGGMPDPYMTNMYNILGSIYPNQNPAQPAGALAPSAPSGGFAPPPNGLPALYNGAQYAGNPFAALLNTASQVNPANYASANTAVKPETLAGTTASGYNPSAFMAPKATKEPWWKPPEAAQPAAATDATAATGVGTTPTNSDANIGGAAVGGGDLAGALGLVNGDAFAGAKGAYSGLLSNVLDAVPSNPLGGLLGSAGRGLMDLLGLGTSAPSTLSQQNPFGLDPAQKAQAAKDEQDTNASTLAQGSPQAPDPAQAAQAAAAAQAQAAKDQEDANASALAQGSPQALDPAQVAAAAQAAKDQETTVEPGPAAPGPSSPDRFNDLLANILGNIGKDDGSPGPDGVSGPGGEGPAGNGGGGGGGGGSSEGGGEHEGGSNAYRGGLIRPHRREGGPVRKHYATSGGVGIADSLYSSDPNSYGYIFGQGTSPASLDQNSYGSAAMNARMGERQQSALQQLAGLGNTLGGLKTGAGVIGDILGGAAKLFGLEQGGRVGRAGGGLVGRHGYEDGGGTGLSWRDGEDQTAYPPTNDVIIQPAPGDFSSWSARQRAAHPERLPANISFVPNRSVGMSPNEVGGIVPPERPPLASVPANTTRFGRLPGASFGYPVGETQYGFYSTEGEHALAEKANEAKLVNEQMLGGSAGGGNLFQPGSVVPSVTEPQAPTGGLLPTAPTDRGENAYARDNNAAPSIAAQPAPPNRGGVLPPHIDEIIKQNTGVNAPVGGGLNVPPGLLGGNGGANSAPNASSAVGAGSTGNAVAPFVQGNQPKGLIPAQEPSWLSQIANVISPDTSSEAPKGSWIDRNKGLLDILSLVGGGLAGMTGKRSLMGLVAGGISGAGAASQAVQKGIADRAKTAAEATNIPYKAETERMQAQTSMQEAALKAHDYINKRFQAITDDPNNPAAITGYYDLDRGGVRVGPEVVANMHAQANSAATHGQNNGPISTVFDRTFGGINAPGNASTNGSAATNKIDFSKMPGTSPEDIDQATRMVLAEAGGEGPDGMRGVAHVIANRSALTGKPLSDVVSQPGQFEPWATKQNVLKNYDPNSAEYKQARDIVQGVLTRPELDITQGSTHFLAPGIMKERGAPLPTWAQTNQPTVTIGGHAYSRGPVNGQLKTPTASGQTDAGAISGPTAAQAQPHTESEKLFAQVLSAHQQAAALPEPQRSVYLARANILNEQAKKAQELELHIDTKNFEMHNDLLDQTGRSAAMANNLKQQSAAFLDALKNQSTGPLAPSLQEISGTLNQLLPGGLGEKISEAVVEYNPNNGATITKINNAMTATLSQLEGSNGRQLLKQWQSASQSTPSIVTPRGASEFLLKNVIQPQADHDINRYNKIKDIPIGRGYNEARTVVQNYDASDPWYKTNEQRRADATASGFPQANPGETLLKLPNDNSGRRFVVRDGKAVEVKP